MVCACECVPPAEMKGTQAEEDGVQVLLEGRLGLLVKIEPLFCKLSDVEHWFSTVGATAAAVDTVKVGKF